jgi:dienelactone hydrolase
MIVNLFADIGEGLSAGDRGKGKGRKRRRSGRPVTFHHYSGCGDWFFEPDRVQAYNPAAASLVWERTLAFLKDSSRS